MSQTVTTGRAASNSRAAGIASLYGDLSGAAASRVGSGAGLYLSRAAGARFMAAGRGAAGRVGGGAGQTVAGRASLYSSTVIYNRITLYFSPAM